MSAGVSSAQVAELEKLEVAGFSVNWAQVWAAVQQYGPQIIAIIMSIFAKPAPGPTPAQP